MILLTNTSQMDKCFQIISTIDKEELQSYMEALMDEYSKMKIF